MARHMKPDYWDSPLDKARKETAGLMGLVARTCGYLGLNGNGPEVLEQWCDRIARVKREDFQDGGGI